MTISGQMPVMELVRVAQLKARLSHYLRLVRRGETVTVLERDTPVARLVPYAAGAALVTRPPRPGAGRPSAVALPPPLRPHGTDAVALLLQERRSGR